MRFFLLFCWCYVAAHLLLACAESPVATAEDAWCNSVAAGSIEGQWSRFLKQYDHTYLVRLEVKAVDKPCQFFYTLNIYNTDHDGDQVYEAYGDIVVLEVSTTGDIINMHVESRRLYLWSFNVGQDPVIDEITLIYDNNEAQVWGDMLVLWTGQFRRVE